MALFPDEPLSSIEDLQMYESSLSEISQSEKIDLDVKLQLSKTEIGHRIRQFLNDQSMREDIYGSCELSQVVISNLLREWHTLHTLHLTLRDCYHNQLNDRYRAKWLEYQRESEQSAIRYFNQGVGIVHHPISKATGPNVGRVSGEVESGLYEISVTWSRDGDAEGSPSDRLYFETDDGSIPHLSTGMVPKSVLFWNVYMGLNGGPLWRQNQEPIGIQDSWTMTSDTVLPGPVIGDGQSPHLLVRHTNRIRRG